MPVCKPADFALASDDGPRLWANVPGPGRDAWRSLIKETMEQTSFVSGFCADIEALAAAVIRQSGGWETFKENAPDISRHGIDGGFHGWTYTVDTVAFYRQNRPLILDWLAMLASDHGVDPVAMVAGWRCMEGCSQAEILATMAGTVINNNVANGLAWGAAEEMARRYSDAWEG